MNKQQSQNLLLKVDPLSTRIRNELIAQVEELKTSAKLTVFVLNISSPLYEVSVFVSRISPSLEQCNIFN